MGSVLIRDGRIAAVGKEVEAPAEARIWEMAGLTIYAGFVDPYLTLKPATNVLGFQSFEHSHDEPRAGRSVVGDDVPHLVNLHLREREDNLHDQHMSAHISLVLFAKTPI